MALPLEGHLAPVQNSQHGGQRHDLPEIIEIRHGQERAAGHEREQTDLEHIRVRNHPVHPPDSLRPPSNLKQRHVTACQQRQK